MPISTGISKVGFVYETPSMNLNLNGEWTGLNTYSGDLGTGDIKQHITLRNLKQYNHTMSLAKDAIDANMVNYITGNHFDSPLTDENGDDLTS